MCCSKGSGLWRKKKSNDGRPCNPDRRYGYQQRKWATIMKEATLDMLGTGWQQLKVDKDNTVIVNGEQAGDAKDIHGQSCFDLRSGSAAQTESEFDSRKNTARDLLSLPAALQLSRSAQLQRLS